MFALAWFFLADQPAYRTGVIIVGLARCIAMVSSGTTSRSAIANGRGPGRLQRALPGRRLALLGYFYLTTLPGWLGFDTQGFEVGIWEVARTVLSSSASRSLPATSPGGSGYAARPRLVREEFIPRIAPLTLYGLLFTIVLLFAIQGEEITSQPLDVARIAVPLLVYFAVMWVPGFAAGRVLGFPYPQTAALSFTVASNDFELAIAVAVGVFGATSGQALAGVVGPLIEVPVLVGSSTSRSGSGDGLVGPSRCGRPRVTEQPPAATIAGAGG